MAGAVVAAGGDVAHAVGGRGAGPAALGDLEARLGGSRDGLASRVAASEIGSVRPFPLRLLRRAVGASCGRHRQEGRGGEELESAEHGVLLHSGDTTAPVWTLRAS